MWRLRAGPWPPRRRVRGRRPRTIQTWAALRTRTLRHGKCCAIVAMRRGVIRDAAVRQSLLSGFSHFAATRGSGPLVRPHRRRAAAGGPNLADVRPWGHRVRGIGLEKYHCRAYELRGDAGMEERDYAACEASFETKSGDEGRAGVGCRRSVSVASGWRIRNDQRAGHGSADAEEHARAGNHPR
jgi:hypothetical protein